MTPYETTQGAAYSLPLEFPIHDVLDHFTARTKRTACLYRAALHSSSFAKPSILWIECSNLCFKVVAKIEAVSQDHVLLENGWRVPTRAISKVA
ncbi:MAG: hypothetical protein AAF193_04650 [Bacteroidota bacterium]